MVKSVESPLFTQDEAAAYLRRSVRGLYDLRKAGKIRFVRDGGKIKYTQAALDGFIAANETMATN